MATRSLQSEATFTQTMPADGLWLVTVSEGPRTNASFGIPGIDSSANATKLAEDLKAMGYYTAVVTQQGA
jgi:hypothetical protein